MTHNNPEERSVEDWETKFREQFMRPGAIDMDLQNVIQFIHHQLQKAREEGERAVWERIKRDANRDETGMYMFYLADHSELDQDVSK